MTVELPLAAHVAFILALTLVMIVLFVLERIPQTLTAVCVITVLLTWFHFFPFVTPAGETPLDARALLAGFGNPSLIAVLALLVVGQAMAQSGALDFLHQETITGRLPSAWVTVGLALLATAVLSAVLNNTPIVVMFIPLFETLARRLKRSPSRLLMPLSYAAILGGTTTLIGSSTNLLVSSALTNMGEAPLSFFSMTPIALILAGVGLTYVIFILPMMLPAREDLAGMLAENRQPFLSEITVAAGSPLDGARPMGRSVPGLSDANLRLLHREGRTILPPFDDIVIAPGDLLIVDAPSETLSGALAGSAAEELEGHRPSALDAREPQADDEGNLRPAGTGHKLAEIMVAPASRMVDRTIEMSEITERAGYMVLGIQRRARPVRGRLAEIRLEVGDILLVIASRGALASLQRNPDVVVLTARESDVPRRQGTGLAWGIFLATVGLAATGIAPIVVAALLGATAMVGAGYLNLRQAARAVDRNIVLIVASAIALGTAMEATGTAALIAESLLGLLAGAPPQVLLGALYLIIALATNLLSNNATALIFTPIAVNLAYSTGIDPQIAAITVLLAANCSFLTPIGYQTNLLVVGPGHYRFRDFIRAGAPLTLLLAITFVLALPLVFDL